MIASTAEASFDRYSGEPFFFLTFQMTLAVEEAGVSLCVAIHRVDAVKLRARSGQLFLAENAETLLGEELPVFQGAPLRWSTTLIIDKTNIDKPSERPCKTRIVFGNPRELMEEMDSQFSLQKNTKSPTPSASLRPFLRTIPGCSQGDNKNLSYPNLNLTSA